MAALEWFKEASRRLAEYMLDCLVAVSLVFAGVALGVGIYEHEWLLCALGTGFAGVAWLFSRLDDMEV